MNLSSTNSNGTISIHQEIKKYKIDFEKLKSLEDVIEILKAMDMTFTTYNYYDNKIEYQNLIESGLIKELKQTK